MTSEFILLSQVLLQCCWSTAPHMPLDLSAVDFEENPDFLIPLPIPVSHTPASFCLLLPSRPITAAVASQLVQLRRLTSYWCVSADVVSLSLYFFFYYPSFKLRVFSIRPLHLIPTHETPLSVSIWVVETRTCLRVLLWRSDDSPLSAQASRFFPTSSCINSCSEGREPFLPAKSMCSPCLLCFPLKSFFPSQCLS